MEVIRATSTVTRIKLYLVACSLLAACFAVAVPASADNTVSQGFTTSRGDLASGTVMGLQPGGKRIVLPAISNKHYQLLGVVANKPLIALSDGNNQVQIVVSGTTYTLVSDINGPVRAGDKITSSPIGGVGMKAIDAGQVVGTAQEDLAATPTTTRSITDKKGKQHTVKLGTIPLQVAVGDYAGVQNDSKLNGILPPAFVTFARSIGGENVSPLRVLLGLIALIIGFIVVGTMLQAGVRSSIISMGRNPLAKKTIWQALTDVSLTALGVLALTFVAVYLVLKV